MHDIKAFPAAKPAADYGRFAAMRERIARIPRLSIAVRPTPMMEAPNLARHLGGPRIFIKRDDLTGVAFGGNKLRNLEFRLARAMEERPDTVIVGLDLQSNSARMTVGACNKLGLRTILVLEGSRPAVVQGNLLVDYLLGAEVRFAPDVAGQRAMMDRGGARHPRGRRPSLHPQRQSDVRCRFRARISRLHAWRCSTSCTRWAPRPTASTCRPAARAKPALALAKNALGGRFTMRGVTASHKHDVPNRTASIANETAAMLALDVKVAAR